MLVFAFSWHVDIVWMNRSLFRVKHLIPACFSAGRESPCGWRPQSADGAAGAGVCGCPHAPDAGGARIYCACLPPLKREQETRSCLCSWWVEQETNPCCWLGFMLEPLTCRVWTDYCCWSVISPGSALCPRSSYNGHPAHVKYYKLTDGRKTIGKPRFSHRRRCCASKTTADIRGQGLLSQSPRFPKSDILSYFKSTLDRRAAEASVRWAGGGEERLWAGLEGRGHSQCSVASFVVCALITTLWDSDCVKDVNVIHAYKAIAFCYIHL